MACRSDLSFAGPRIIPSLCVVHAGACGERSVGVLVRWGQRPVQQGRQGPPPHGQGARAVDVYVSAERYDPNVSRIRGRHRCKHRSRLIYRNIFSYLRGTLLHPVWGGVVPVFPSRRGCCVPRLSRRFGGCSGGAPLSWHLGTHGWKIIE